MNETACRNVGIESRNPHAKRLAGSIAALLMATCSTTNPARPERGVVPWFENLRWGMTRQQVEAAIGQVQSVEERPGHFVLQAPARIIDGCSFDIAMEFFGPYVNSLTIVRMTLVSSDVVACAEMVQRQVDAKLGVSAVRTQQTDTLIHPDRSTSIRAFERREWSAGQTVVSSSMGPLNSGGDMHYTVWISHNGAPGTVLE